MVEYAVSLDSDIKDKTDDPEQALLLILLKVSSFKDKMDDLWTRLITHSTKVKEYQG